MIREADPLLAITALRTMDEVVGGALSRARSGMALLSVSAGAALALAAVGLYGVVAFTVAQRRREIGIRLALGASGRQIATRFARGGGALVAVGGVLGAGASVPFTAVLRQLNADASPLDPLTLAAVVLVLAGVGVVATVVPARRATQVDPLSTLRAE